MIPIFCCVGAFFLGCGLAWVAYLKWVVSPCEERLNRLLLLTQEAIESDEHLNRSYENETYVDDELRQICIEHAHARKKTAQEQLTAFLRGYYD